MSGSVTVKSKVGEGTTFTVRLKTVTRHKKIPSDRSFSGSSAPNTIIDRITPPRKLLLS